MVVCRWAIDLSSAAVSSAVISRCVGSFSMSRTYRSSSSWGIVTQVAEAKNRFEQVAIHLLSHRRVAIVAERRATGEQKTQRATQGVQIRAVIHRVCIVPLLGGHVVGSAQHLPRLRELPRLGTVGQQPRQPEVEHFHLALLGEQQIRRLDVAMDQALGVGRRQAERRVPHHHTSIRDAPWSTGLDVLRQVHAFDILHDQKVQPGDLATVSVATPVAGCHHADREVERSVSHRERHTRLSTKLAF